MYKYLLKKCLYPLMELYFGTNTLPNLDYLKKTQWYTSEQIQDLQNEKLKVIIKHAYENVPYYNKLFESLHLTPENIKTTDDLVKLPILTKNDIRQNLDSLVAVNIPKRQLLKKTTGGSTGTPLKFVRDKASMGYIRAAQYRFFEWAGLDVFGDKWAIFTASSQDLKLFDKSLVKLYFRLMKQKKYGTSSVNDELFYEYINDLNKFKPKFLYGYASSLYTFGKFLYDSQIDTLKVESIITDSDTLYPHYRALLTKQFDCEIFDHYGSKEATYAQECEFHSGYHVAAENIHLEFVDHNGVKVDYGKNGRILVTDFTNFGMPLIRYENGDMGIPSNKKCKCNRGLPLIESITGRTSDLLVTEYGKIVSPTAITVLFGNLSEDIDKYQIIQKKHNELVVKIVPTKDYNEDCLKLINEHISNLFSNNCKINFQIVDQIKVSESGKRRITVCEITNE